MDSIFRVLEPVVDKINEKTKQPISLGSRLGFRAARSDWFRVYKVRRVAFRLVRGIYLSALETGLLPAVRVVRLDLPQGADRGAVHQGL
jgi:hypothetical protein